MFVSRLRIFSEVPPTGGPIRGVEHCGPVENVHPETALAANESKVLIELPRTAESRSAGCNLL